MTLEELCEMLEDFAPDYRISTDKRGQIVIYTGLAEDSEGELVSVNEANEDEDFDDDEDDDEDFDDEESYDLEEDE